MKLHPFRLRPVYQRRIWGGDRLTVDSEAKGEVRLVAAECSIQGTDQTLGELALEQGASLTGTLCAGGGRVLPIILKLLDTQDWLSIQVHPSKNQAEEGFARRYLRIDGDWRDHVIYAMLNTDPRPLTMAETVRRPVRRRFKPKVKEALARSPSGAKLSSGGS